jgi:hypothetical protein
MIRIKNTAEYDELLESVNGTALTAATVAFMTIPAAGYIKSIVAELAIPGSATGANDFWVDLKKIPIATGTAASIFPNGATAPIVWSHTGGVEAGGTIPVLATSYNGQITGEGVSMPAVAVAKGDVLIAVVTQILNGTVTSQPADLGIYVVLTRGQGWAPEATLLGQFSELDF